MKVNWFQLKSFLINRFFEVKTLLKLIMLSSPDLIPKKMCLRRGGGLHESVSNINYYVCCCCALGRLTWLPIAFLLLCSWLANITSCLLLLLSWLSNTSSYYVFAATILAFQHNSYYVYIYICVCVCGCYALHCLTLPPIIPAQSGRAGPEHLPPTLSDGMSEKMPDRMLEYMS